MADPADIYTFLARLGQRASRADAVRAAKLAQLRDEIARSVQAQRGLYGRVVSSDGTPYPQYMDQFDAVSERMERLARAEAAMTDDRPYLETVRRAYRAPGEPDMSLDSPLFQDMYKADRAFEQLRKGRTSNLRNAGGGLADVASQAIREADAAAAAGRGATMLDRAGEIGPEAAVMLGALGGAAAAAPAGMAIDSALEARRQRQAAGLAAQRAAEAFAAQQASIEQQYMNDMDGFDPIGADVVSPEFDDKLLADLAAQSYPSAIRPRSVGAVDAYAHKLGLPSFPGTVLEEEAVPRRIPAPHFMSPLGRLQ